MRTKRALTGLTMLFAVVAVPAVTLAAVPDYTYLEGGYVDIDVDNLSSVGDDGDGYFLGVSFALSKSLHVFWRYNSSETDDLDIDITTWWAGAGWHGLLGERGDIVAEVQYIDSEYELSIGNKVTADGWGARGGVRFRLLEMLELGAFAKYENLDEESGVDIGGSEWGYEANAIVHFRRFGIGLAYEDIDDVESFSGFVRFNFGNP